MSWIHFLKISLLRGIKALACTLLCWNQWVHPTHSWAENKCVELPTENKNLESFLSAWCHCYLVQSRQNRRSGKQESMEISRCGLLLCCHVKSCAVKVFSPVCKLSLRSKVSAQHVLSLTRICFLFLSIYLILINKLQLWVPRGSCVWREMPPSRL